MDRWNELIAGFVLGNLTPEEAKSIAKILAENPQLASHIARLRNTATVRSLSRAERLSARSQDGSEGWADTALDSSLPYHLSNNPGLHNPGLSNPALSNPALNNPELNGLSVIKPEADTDRLGNRLKDSSLKDSVENRLEAGLEDRLADGLANSLEEQFAQRSVPTYLDSDRQNSEFSAASDDTFNATASKAARNATRRAIRQDIRKERRLSRLTFERFSLERFSLAEALLVPVFNPLWWTAIAIAVAVSIDNFRVRRSLQDIQEELTELKAAPQIAPVETISPDRIFPNGTIAPSQPAQ